MENNLKHFQKLARVLHPNNVLTPEDLEQIMVGIMEIMVSFKQGNEKMNKETKELVTDGYEKIVEAYNTIKDIEVSVAKSKNDTDSIATKTSKKFDAQAKELKAMVEDFMSMKPLNGVDADEEAIVEKVLEKIIIPEFKETILDTAEDIASKLESLKDDERLDFSALKNVPEITQSKANGGGWRNLSLLQDVKITTPLNNQLLKYNSTTSQWENGTGGGASTLADVATGSTTTPNSLYTMTSTIPVEFRRSAGASLLFLDETTGNVGIGATALTTSRVSIADTTLAGSGALAGTLLDLAQTWNTTGTPTAIKLNITDTASNANSNLMDLQTGGTSRFRVDKTGNLIIFSGSITLTNGNFGNGTYTNSGGYGATTVTSFNSIPSVAPTSAAVTSFRSAMNFNPASGTGTYIGLNVTPIINQTGGANGITRGIYVNPTLTAAADFRAIETTNGTIRLADTYASGSGSLAGSLLDLTQTWNTTGTPTAILFNVTDTASNAASNLMDLRVGGSSRFRVTKGGSLEIFSTMNASSFNSNGSSTSLNFRGGAGATAIYSASMNPLGSATFTSGTGGSMLISSTNSFAPTSGTGVYNMVSVESVINQTGGASGISRGIFINPTLTASADFRAIQTAQGSLVMNDTYLSGSGSLARSLVDLTQTWNTTGAPTAIKLNVTDTASNAASDLMELQVGGTSMFIVNKTGATTSLYQRFGSGTPEGVVTAPIGAFYSRTDGGALTSFYVKESGAGNTGWVAK